MIVSAAAAAAAVDSGKPGHGRTVFAFVSEKYIWYTWSW